MHCLKPFCISAVQPLVFRYVEPISIHFAQTDDVWFQICDGREQTGVFVVTVERRYAVCIEEDSS